MNRNDVLFAWIGGREIPGGWTVEADSEPEGGQANGMGEIEPSDFRDWYTPERESHHRERLVITVTGPWVDGPTDYAALAQHLRTERIVRERKEYEDAILAQADRIRTERGL